MRARFWCAATLLDLSTTNSAIVGEGVACRRLLAAAATLFNANHILDLSKHRTATLADIAYCCGAPHSSARPATFGRDRSMARKSASAGDGEPIIIKKYANRRLYNTQSSKYITLDFLAELTRKDVQFKVVDAKTSEDITHSVLTQIIMEEETAGQGMLPVNFLRQIIALYGDSMQGLVPQFLESSMDNFRKNQKQVQDVIESAITSGPFGHIAKQNIEMMRAARDAFVPNLGGKKEKPKDDLASLKKQMEELQAKIDKLSRE
jgi:polyhydroxyalkanoate synthesis repressor PhaR